VAFFSATHFYFNPNYNQETKMKRISKFIPFAVLFSLLLVLNCGNNGTGSSNDVSTIKIMNTADGSGTEINVLGLQPGQKETLYAVCYNSSNEVIKDISVTWSVSNSIGTITVNNGTSTILTAGIVAAPTGLKSITKKNAIGLTWTAGTTVPNSYNVYHSTTYSGTGTLAKSVTVTSADDSVANGTQYYFYVIGVDMNGKITATSDNGKVGTTGNITVTGQSNKSNIVDDAAEPQYFSSGNSLYPNTSNLGESAILFSTGAFEFLSAGHGEADIYLYNDGSDLYLRSTGGFLSSFTRTCQIYYFGVFDFNADQVSIAPAYTTTGYATSQKVVDGGVYSVHTSDNNYVKVQVTSVSSVPLTDRYIIIAYGYQSIVGYTNFKAASR
jgi:hypothetical protein